MSKKSGGFVPFDLDALEPDPAVSALVSRGQVLEAERRLPAKVRQKKARQREKDQARSKALYDLPPEIIEAVAQVAKRHSTTASGVAGLALVRFLADVREGRVNLRDYLEPIDSPRYVYRVKLGE